MSLMESFLESQIKKLEYQGEDATLLRFNLKNLRSARVHEERRESEKRIRNENRQFARNRANYETREEIEQELNLEKERIELERFRLENKRREIELAEHQKKITESRIKRRLEKKKSKQAQVSRKNQEEHDLNDEVVVNNQESKKEKNDVLVIENDNVIDRSLTFKEWAKVNSPDFQVTVEKANIIQRILALIFAAVSGVIGLGVFFLILGVIESSSSVMEKILMASLFLFVGMILAVASIWLFYRAFTGHSYKAQKNKSGNY